MDQDWNDTDIEWTQGVMPHSAYDAPANLAANDALPARPVTDRNPGVGAKKHFSCAFVYGPGAGVVMNTESLTENLVGLVLLAVVIFWFV